MSLTRKAPAAVKKKEKPQGQDLAQALADCEAELAEARLQQAATAEILKVIAASPADAQPAFEAIADRANRLMGGFSTAVFRILGEAVHLAAFTSTDPSADETLRARFPVPVTQFPGLESISRGESAQIADTELNAGLRDLARLRGYRSMLFAPLMSNGAPIGIISVTRETPGAFSARQVQLLQTFADQAVIAINNVGLFNETQEALKQQTATADVLKVISRSAFNLQAVFETLLDSAVALSGAWQGTICIRDGDVFTYRAVRTAVGTEEFDDKIRTRLFNRKAKADRTTLAGRAILSGKVEQIEDIFEDPEYWLQGAAAKTAGIRAVLGVPLLRNDRAEGALVLSRRQPGRYSPRVVELIRTFADQAVIAIENARLFDEVQAKTRDLSEALVHQTASGNILKVIASSPTKVAPALQAIVEGACEVCDAYDAAVILREGDHVRFSAHCGPIPIGLETWPLSRGWVGGRSIVDKAPVHVPDLQLAGEEFPDGRDFALRMGHRTILAAPLMREAESVGAIVVRRKEAHPFSDKQIELLRGFADQAVIAIGNVRLFDEVQAKTRDLEESLQQQTATADVLKVISRSAFNLQAVLDTLVRSAAELSESSSGIIYLEDDNAFHINAHFGMRAEFVRYLEQNPQKPGRGSVGGRILLTGALQNIPDAQADEEYDPVLKSNPTTRALLGVPLLRDGKTVGAIFLARARPVAFSQRQIELVQTFADQAVIAIENVRLFDEVQARTRDLAEALQQQTATADVLKVISRSAFDLQAVFDTLIASAVELSGSHSGAICVRDGEIFRYRSSSGPGASSELHNYLVEHPANPGRGSLVGRAVLSRQVEQIPDIYEDSEYSVPTKTHGNPARALVGVPLLGKDRVEGAIVLTRLEPGAFPSRQIEILQTFADQAVIAIENARLFDEVQAKTRDLEESLQQQTATADVLKVISRSAFDLQAVLDTLASSAAVLCGASNGLIYLQSSDSFEVRAATKDWNPETFRLLSETPHRPGRRTVGARVLLTGEVQNIADMQADPDYDPSIRSLSASRALLGVPLKRGDAVIGAFVLARREAGAYSQRQVQIVQTFADQAVIAIENARLLDEVQAKTRDLEESLQQQTATADVLKVISRSAFDLPTVLRTLVESAAKLCDADKATITREVNGVYYRAESYGFSEEFMDQIRNIPVAPERGSITGLAMLEGKAIQVEDVEADPDYWPKNFAKPGELRTGLGIPMMRNGAPIGVLALMRTEVRPFNAKQIELVQTFADQAVIAIENARLFDEVQAKTRDLEESLAQQTATADVLKVISRSAFNLQAVLTTLAESARDLCGASFVTLFMRDGEEMRLRAESGCTPEIVAFLHAHPIRAGRETFTGRVMLSGEAVHLPDVLADPEYDFGDAPRIGNYRAMLGVPLLRDGQVEGVFALARPEPTPFTARQVEMVRAFADQAVIAIENARLFDEVQARTRELAASLDDLRKAQDRLVQSEKLASLGQLTAGIAHEIKNPLNFINNYSALSRELIDELAEAIGGAAANGAAHAETDELIGAIGGNLDKIVQHGKRADSIVKNMLLHSREGSGERSATNVNTMVEEALNLAYHGARAEKPGFNVTIVKSLDPNAGLAEVYAQEMTRVLLNLISNGFYATSKRKQSLGDGAYEPTISASTRDLGPKVEIAIRDNGTGIPEEVKAKMFNPFFTTKPAGEGTGLGLSLSHDIVVKQHGGLIEVLTEPDAFTEFTIVLPRGAAGA